MIGMGKITAIYCRTAHKDKTSMDMQKRGLLEFARQHGHGNVCCYIDKGASGLIFDRPGFQKMEMDIQAGKIKAVIVKDVSRIGRHMLGTVKWVNDLAGKGISFICTTRPYENFTFMAQLSEWYSEL